MNTKVLSKDTTKETALTKLPIVILLAAICCFCGEALPCIKIGYQLFHIASTDTASQLLFAGLRFTLAGILVILVGSLSGHRFLFPAKASLLNVCKLSLLQTILQYFFFYVGLANASGVKSSIIEASSTFLSILIASLIFRYEKLTASKLAGCILGFGRRDLSQRSRKRYGFPDVLYRGGLHPDLCAFLCLFLRPGQEVFCFGKPHHLKRISVRPRGHCLKPGRLCRRGTYSWLHTGICAVTFVHGHDLCCSL